MGNCCSSSTDDHQKEPDWTHQPQSQSQPYPYTYPNPRLTPDHMTGHMTAPVFPQDMTDRAEPQQLEHMADREGRSAG